jgi:glucose/arabinose dehydrogenase
MDQVIGEERLFAEEFGRIRDIAVGPDGALYFSTSNRDNRWPSAPDDDHIFRVVPAT